MTLLEILAVVVLLGIVTAVVAPGLMAALVNDPLSEAVQQCRSAAGAARVAAQTSGRRLDLRPDGLVVYDDHGHEIQAVRCDTSISIAWHSDGPMTFDPSGRIAPFQGTFRRGDRVLQVAVDGIAGCWTITRGSP